MKTIKLFLLLVLVIVFFSPNLVFGQKKAQKVSTKITLYDDIGNSYPFVGDGIEVNASESIFLRTLKIKVPKEILENFTFEPYANIWIETSFEIDMDDDGIKETKVFDTCAFLNKSGNLSVSFHLNGSGNWLPKAWSPIGN